jgi:AcrR family transcriptional regulator
MGVELDNTEKKIVDATFEILRKEGVEKATTKRIASEAGVNEVTIFRKFKNKNNLIEITKQYYMNILLSKLEDIFAFNGDEEIDEYLNSNFMGFLNLPEENLSIIKIAMEEIRDISGKKLIISTITNTIIGKLEEYFKLQKEKGNIRDIDTRVLSVMCFSMTFQSIVLWKVYDNTTEVKAIEFGKNYLDMLLNGIKP